MPRGLWYKRLKFTCLTTREIYGKEKRSSKKIKERTSTEINYSDVLLKRETLWYMKTMVSVNIGNRTD